MKKMFWKGYAILLVLFLSCILPLDASNIAGGHRGGITSIIHNGNTVITGSEDGFIVIWNTQQQTALERFQLTPYKILNMVKHPTREEICIIESGDMDNYRISVWNYKRRERLFSVYSSEPVMFANYSAGGNFIITTGLDGPHLTLLDSVTGNVLSALDIPQGTTTFGITGRTERNLFLYQAEYDDIDGQILYLDLNSASITGRFQAPAGLSSPVVFSNNRFLAGVNSTGLVIVNAASGEIISNMDNFERNALLFPASDGFYCLNLENDSLFLYRFTVDRRGNINIRQKNPVFFNAADTISAFAYNGNGVFADTQGKLFLIGQQGRGLPFAYNNQMSITEISSSQSSIAALTKNNELFFIPLDFLLLQNNQSINLLNKTGYTRITSLTEEDRFVLWQTANTRIAPLLIQNNTDAGTELNVLTGRFPLRTISTMNGKILVLDTAGNVSVRNTDNLSGRADFTFSSVGVIDASFVNEEYFILCRSVVGANTPFLFVNYNTGETVPVPYPAQAGIMSYTGSSGITYAAAVEQDIAWKKTTVIRLSASATTAGSPVSIMEYPGEDIILSIAESAHSNGVQYSLAIAAGGSGAKIYADEIVNFERTNGLPVKLLGSADVFLSLDSEGNISWHDNRSGRLLAVFRLYEDRWFLTRDNREISGRLLR